MLPQDMGMEGCPAESHTLLYLILSSLWVPFLFVCFKLVQNWFRSKRHRKKTKSSRRRQSESAQFAKLQLEMFGVKSPRTSQGSEERSMSATSVSSSSEHVDDVSGDEEQGYEI